MSKAAALGTGEGAWLPQAFQVVEGRLGYSLKEILVLGAGVRGRVPGLFVYVVAGGWPRQVPCESTGSAVLRRGQGHGSWFLGLRLP